MISRGSLHDYIVSEKVSIFAVLMICTAGMSVERRGGPVFRKYICFGELEVKGKARRREEYIGNPRVLTFLGYEWARSPFE